MTDVGTRADKGANGNPETNAHVGTDTHVTCWHTEQCGEECAGTMGNPSGGK